MKIKNKKIENDKINSFLASLHFLSEEASRESMPEVHEVMINAINSIQNWMNGNDIETSELCDQSLYDAIDFLSKFSSLSNDQQKALICLFEVSEEKKTINPLFNRETEYH